MRTPELTAGSAVLLARLEEAVRRHGRLVVAFSGGADSALLAHVATVVLGRDAVLCATAVSPSLAPEDRDETRALADDWGLRYLAVETHELENPAYQANGLDRCFYCKAELMTVLGPVAAAEAASVALGVNLDDLGDYRPGQAAAREAGAVFPLVEAALQKSEVRELSRELGLRTWDKPANACLSSRIPQGTPVTVGLLGQVARAESALRRLGFAQLRVRHYGDLARIELAEEELPLAIASREEIVSALKATGYRYVTVDLEGFRSGNLVRTALSAEADRKGR